MRLKNEDVEPANEQYRYVKYFYFDIENFFVFFYIEIFLKANHIRK